MSKLQLRDIESVDLPRIIELMETSWDWAELFETLPPLEATLGMYLNQVLYDSSFAKVALLNGSIVGAIFGSAERDTPKYRMLMSDPTYHILALLNAPEEERKSVYEYMSKTLKVYEQMLEDEGNHYDGTLDFFVVAGEAKGHGIGKALWRELAAYFTERQAKQIYVYTDTTCNIGFYEHLGFTKKSAHEVTYFFDGEPETQTLFLYDYQF